jgi:hypothetical protein
MTDAEKLEDALELLGPETPTMADIKVGQNMVLATPPRHGEEWKVSDITITKVGRAYAYFGDFRRFGLKTMRDYSYPGCRVFVSREAFEEDRKRSARWATFHAKVRRMLDPPDHITTQMIERAAAALEIEL